MEAVGKFVEEGPLFVGQGAIFASPTGGVEIVINQAGDLGVQHIGVVPDNWVRIINIKTKDIIPARSINDGRIAEIMVLAIYASQPAVLVRQDGPAGQAGL